MTTSSVMKPQTHASTDRRAEALAALLREHGGVLRRTALFLTRRCDRADDAVQETLLKAWRAKDRLDPAREPRAWLLTILRRTIFDAARRRRVRGGAQSLDEARPEGVADPTTTASGALDPLERQDILDAIARLPGEYREVVRLVVVEERAYRDAAARLGVPVGTVMSRLHRGRRILRRRLAAYAPEGALRAEGGPSSRSAA